MIEPTSRPCLTTYSVGRELFLASEELALIANGESSDLANSNAHQNG
jgi:hypothetical protein